MIIAAVMCLVMFFVMIIITRKFVIQTEELKKMNQLLFQKTMLDELSGLYNYRYFIERLQHLWEQGIKEQTELSLAIVDIDFFKKYNDYYGHQEGNHCIKTISDLLNTDLSAKNGFTARYGGEEFVIVLPDTGTAEAGTILEDLRSVIENKKIEHIKSELYRYVTISVGIATMVPVETVNFDTLIKRADYALYEAKKSGRNKCVTEDELDTIGNINKLDGRFVFPAEQKEAYERLILPVGIFQFIDGKIVTLLVSDGLCEMLEVGRLELTKHYDSNMFGNVHPDDVQQLSKRGYEFAREIGDYNVTYRTRFHKEEYHHLHVVGRFQTVGEDTRVAFLVYTELNTVAAR